MDETIIYPRLSNLVKVRNLPEELSFIQGGVEAVLGGLFYRNLQARQSADGVTVSYNLEIVSPERLSFDIPGTGISLVLNPDYSGTDASIIPISISCSIGIRKYVKSFKFDQFSFDAIGFYNLLLSVSGQSEISLLDTFISQFVMGPDPMNEFADFLNQNYGLNIAIPVSSMDEIALEEILTEINNSNSSLPEIMFTDFIFDSTSIDQSLHNIEKLFQVLIGARPLDQLKSLLVPRVRASLGLSAGIEFSRDILQPMKVVNGVYEVEPNEAIKSILFFDNTNFEFDSTAGIGFNEDLQAGFHAPYDRAQIGNTGLVIGINTAKLDLSRKKNIAEAEADGRPEDFVGVYIKDSLISFPAFWNHDDNNSTGVIQGKNLIIGTGGISGTLSLEAKQGVTSAPLIKANLGGGFEISLTSFSITFKQNSITESNIKGKLKIPGLNDTTDQPAEIDIDVFIGTDGDFKITASEEQGIEALRLPNVFDMSISSLSVGRKNDKWFVAIAGEINFTADVPGLGDVLPKQIAIKKLLIWEDGNLEFDAGGITLLPKAISLNIGPVKMSVSSLQLGSHEQMHNQDLRQYLYFGFDGSVNVNPGGVNVKGEGIKFYFTKSGSPFHCFLRLQRIDIDMIIPGNATKESAALLLKGYVAMSSPPGAAPALEEYSGGVDFKLPKLKMGGSAAMRLKPKTGAFVIDASLEMSTPIALGTTGLGIYGFRGLVGKDYVASKSGAGLPDDAAWWQYYKAPPQEGIVIDKLDDTKKGFSLGAGVSLATTADSGRSFSSKLFFLLSLPEVFLLQGQAAVMAERIGLDTTEDPPFFALLSISNKSVEAALGVKYQVPQEGDFKILNIEGVLEMAYFFGNSAGWYINIGRDQPENMRVRAEIFSIFNGYAYLMISAAGLRTGAGITWELQKNFGPVGLHLGAYMHTQGRISFKPVQLGGSLLLGGFAKIKVFKFKFGFDVSAMLAAELPKPFVISGEFVLSIDLPKPFKDIEVRASLRWEKSTNNDSVEVLLVNETSAMGVNVLTSETYKLEFLGSSLGTPSETWSVLPLDTYIDLEFTKPVLPNTSNTGIQKIGGVIDPPEFMEMVPPQKGISQQHKHEYVLNKFSIKYYNNGTWEPYDIYAACMKPSELTDPDIMALLNKLKHGYWQLMDGKNRYSKLRILSQSPFSYTTHNTEPMNIEWMGIWSKNILCPPKLKEHICQTWNGYTLPTEFPADEWVNNGQLQTLSDNPSYVANPINVFKSEQALAIVPESTLELKLPDNSKIIELKLETLSEYVTVLYYTKVTSSGQNQSKLYPGYSLVKREKLNPWDLYTPLYYFSETDPVGLVVIMSGPFRSDNKTEGGYYDGSGGPGGGGGGGGGAGSGNGPAGLYDVLEDLATGILTLQQEIQDLQDLYDDQVVNDPAAAPNTLYQLKEKQKELEKKQKGKDDAEDFKNDSSDKADDINNDPAKKFKDKAGETKTIITKLVNTSRYITQEIINGNKKRIRRYYQLPEKLSNGKRYVDRLIDRPDLINTSKELRYIKGKNGMQPTYDTIRDYLRRRGALSYYPESIDLFQGLRKMLEVFEHAFNRKDLLTDTLNQDLKEILPIAWYIQEAARYDLSLSPLDVEDFPDLLSESLGRRMSRAYYRLRIIKTDETQLRNQHLTDISGLYTSLQSTITGIESELITLGILSSASPGTDLERLIRGAEVFYYACANLQLISLNSKNTLSSSFEDISELDAFSKQLLPTWTNTLQNDEIRMLKMAQHLTKVFCRQNIEGQSPIPPNIHQQMDEVFLQHSGLYNTVRNKLVAIGVLQGEGEMLTPCQKIAELLKVFELAFIHFQIYPAVDRPILFDQVLPAITSIYFNFTGLVPTTGYLYNEDDLYPLLAAQYLSKKSCTHLVLSTDYSSAINQIIADTQPYYGSLFTTLTGLGVALTPLNGNFCGDLEKFLEVLELGHVYHMALSTPVKVNRLAIIGKYRVIYELVWDETGYPFSIADEPFMKKVRMSRFYLANLKSRGFVFRNYLKNKLSNLYNTLLLQHYSNLKSSLINLNIMAPFSDLPDITDQLFNAFDVFDNSALNLNMMSTPDRIETVEVKNKIDGLYQLLKDTFDNGSGISSLGQQPTPGLVSATQRYRVGLNRYSDFSVDVQTGLDNDAPTIIENIIETQEEIYTQTVITDNPDSVPKEPHSTRDDSDKSKAGMAADRNEDIESKKSEVPPALQDELDDRLNEAEELSEKIKEELADIDIVKEEEVVYHETVAEELLLKPEKFPRLKNEFNAIKSDIDIIYNNLQTLPPSEQAEVQTLKNTLDLFDVVLTTFVSKATSSKDYELLKEEDFDFDVSRKNLEDLSSLTEEGMQQIIDTVASIQMPIEPGSSMVYTTCFTTPEIEEYNASLMGFTQIEDDTKTMTTALNHVVQPIWRPNTYFAIEMETIDRVNGNDNFVKNHVFGFRTKGPIGHYHKGLPAYIDLENENKHEEFQLKDLQQYLDFDKSFPHPGSKMLDAKPLYYNNVDFSLIFKQQYTYHMFNDWAQYGTLDPLTSKIELVVKGSVPDQDVENPQEPTWVKVPVPIFFWYRNDLAVLDAVINETPPDNNCIQLAHQFAIPYFKIQVQKSLKPETLYTAIWKCNFGVSGGTLQKEEVWRYGFQSSRYGSLNDQLQSYVLSTEPGNERKALYSIPVVWDSATQIEAVKELNSQSLSDTTLYDKYAISFDRLINGILKVGQIPATDNFEVNVFKEGAVIKGILVRSPEPFIDPRLPKTEIDSSLVLSLNVGGIPDNTPLRVAFSKDTSQVFISNDNMDIAAGDLNLNFKFKLFDFDTNAFVVKQQANITIDLTTV